MPQRSQLALPRGHPRSALSACHDSPPPLAWPRKPRSLATQHALRAPSRVHELEARFLHALGARAHIHAKESRLDHEIERRVVEGEILRAERERDGLGLA